MNIKLWSMFFALVLVAGCATTPPPITGRPELLNFLSDAKTTKEEVITTLGQPSGKFEREKILTYRLGFKTGNKGFYVVEQQPGMPIEDNWADAKYSLVLVFDEKNVLRKHSLVEVR
jgi:hypothetical protein